MRLPDSLRRKARSSTEATERWRHIIQTTLTCIDKDVHLFCGPSPIGSNENLLALSPYADPIPLDTKLGIPLYLDFQQSAERVEDHRWQGHWKMSTRSYHYGLLAAPDEKKNPLIAWDWHPSGTESVPHPHIHTTVNDHLGKGPRLHVPTGSRVLIEQVVRFLIDDLGVVHQRSDWPRVLDENEHRFNTFQTQDTRR